MRDLLLEPHVRDHWRKPLCPLLFGSGRIYLNKVFVNGGTVSALFVEEERLRALEESLLEETHYCCVLKKPAWRSQSWRVSVRTGSEGV